MKSAVFIRAFAVALALAQATALALPSWYDPELMPEWWCENYCASYGDAEYDGMVDLADFTIVKKHFGWGHVDGWTSGDANGDQMVQLDDFVILKQHFGDFVPHDQFDSGRIIPEPLTATATLIALAALGRYVRRRHKP